MSSDNYTDLLQAHLVQVLGVHTKQPSLNTVLLIQVFITSKYEVLLLLLYHTCPISQTRRVIKKGGRRPGNAKKQKQKQLQNRQTAVQQQTTANRNKKNNNQTGNERKTILQHCFLLMQLQGKNSIAKKTSVLGPVLILRAHQTD